MSLSLVAQKVLAVQAIAAGSLFFALAAPPAQALTEYSFSDGVGGGANWSERGSGQNGLATGTLSGTFALPTSPITTGNSFASLTTNQFIKNLSINFNVASNTGGNVPAINYFFNTISYLSSNATTAEIVFYCITGNGGTCNTASGEVTNEYQLNLLIPLAAGSSLTSLVPTNLGNINQLCIDPTNNQFIGGNGCAESDRVEVIFKDPAFIGPPGVQVPAPLPVLGAAAAFGWSRRLRKKIRNSTQRAAVTL